MTLLHIYRSFVTSIPNNFMSSITQLPHFLSCYGSVVERDYSTQGLSVGVRVRGKHGDRQRDLAPGPVVALRLSATHNAGSILPDSYIFPLSFVSQLLTPPPLFTPPPLPYSHVQTISIFLCIILAEKVLNLTHIDI